MTEAVFERLGARPIINGMGIFTKLGGSIISQATWAAMTEANDSAIEMSDLLEASGKHLAKFLDVEAARVVPGVAAGLAMGIAACITRQDPSAVERLPDVSGLKSGLVFQPKQRYRYLRAAWLSGAHPIWAGDDDGTTLEQLDEAMASDEAVAALFPAHLDGTEGAVGLREFSAIARRRGVPVVIDAAFMSYPPSNTGSYRDLGDLVGLSAKYYFGPNGGGFLYGGQEFIDLVAALDFTRFETGEWRTYGRAFKLDRHTVVGTIVALEEWFTMDHEERLAGYRRTVRVLEEALRGIPGVRALPRYFAADETIQDEPVNALLVEVDPAVAGISAADLHAALYDGNPRVLCHLEDSGIVIAVEAMVAGGEEIVGQRLREILRA